jgi:hypothetical protein
VKPVKQRYRHDPENGVCGDCHRAAMASILDRDIDDVPHFCDGDPSGEEFNRRIDQWLDDQGLVQFVTPFSGDLPLGDILRSVSANNPGHYYILGGESRTGVNHSVVCHEGEIVHDPSPTDAGIVGPMNDGMYVVTFFGRKL